MSAIGVATDSSMSNPIRISMKTIPFAASLTACGNVPGTRARRHATGPNRPVRKRAGRRE